MSIFGFITNIQIVTLQDELDSLSPIDRGCESYVVQKHETAKSNDRYVVLLTINEGPIKNIQQAFVFIPKGVIDNHLLELGTYVDCSGQSCTMEIFGVQETFDRACNGATQIHDIRFRTVPA